MSAVGSVGSVERAFGVKEQLFSYRGLTLRGDGPTARGSFTRWQRACATWTVSTRQTGSCARPRGHPESRASGRRPLPGPGCGSARGRARPLSGRPRSDRDAARVPVRIDASRDTMRIHAAADPGRPKAVDGTSLTGEGISVGITDPFASPTIVQDVNRFSAHYGLRPPERHQLPADRKTRNVELPGESLRPSGLVQQGDARRGVGSRDGASREDSCFAGRPLFHHPARSCARSR